MSEANISTAAELDRQTEARLKEIESEVRRQPLTGERRPIGTLREHYGPTQTAFVRGCEYLTTQYSHYRAIRGDGNCYYRAFLYRLTELLLTTLPPKHPEGLRILDWIKTTSWQQVLAAGYSEFAVETFYDEIVELIQDVVVDRTKSFDDWHASLNEENAASDYCTWYLRVLTATYLKASPDRFLPFIEEQQQHVDMAQYCARDIEPMGRECEMVSVLALAEAVGVRVSVEYLDGRRTPLDDDDATTLARHAFGPDDAQLSIEVLYRPGHYGESLTVVARCLGWDEARTSFVDMNTSPHMEKLIFEDAPISVMLSARF